jgi:CBS domain-containing protein
MATKVREVMTPRPRCAAGSTPLSQVAELMAAEDVGAIPVVEGEMLVGMVTDRDIVVRAIAQGKDPRGMPASEIASRDLVTVEEDSNLSAALEVMAQHQVRRLPVVALDGRLVGMLSQADVALAAREKAVGEMVEDISEPPSGPRAI